MIGETEIHRRDDGEFFIPIVRTYEEAERQGRLSRRKTAREPHPPGELDPEMLSSAVQEARKRRISVSKYLAGIVASRRQQVEQEARSCDDE